MAILLAVQQLNCMGYNNVAILGDSLQIFKSLNLTETEEGKKKISINEATPNIVDILALSQLNRFCFHWVPRNFVQYADHLANRARSSMQQYIFIPYSFIEKEDSQVEGFSPELALVTVGGGNELEEKLVVRPTSETIVNHPANVTRWEMRTKPFIRTLEFLWQEGHTAHATPEEAEKEAKQMIEIYTRFAFEQTAIPVIAGRKSKLETFAGADTTYTIEVMMGDRKALQAGTSHNLGQNFSRAFGTQFHDEDGERQHVWQTSLAVSTRFVGGIIMTHGDDTGLMLPPKIAPIQVVTVPIWKKETEKTGVLTAASSVKEVLQAAGGVPIRIEIGPRDVSSNCVVVSRRNIPGKAGKVFGISMEPSTLVSYGKEKLDEIQSSLLEKAVTFRDINIVDVKSYEELKVAISSGKWARGPWSASDSDEQRVKEETGATIQCFPFEQT
ncbi:unnamed protein product [Brassica napus]|uniref:(rape) hypothetical protein n=1 Tax=Brassica napus TaxID=3708 RepID=A0A817BAB3_BRANA|nr:unnamed protein product [Brassica napus]